MAFQTIDPSSGRPLDLHPSLSAAEATAALDRAGRAQLDWAAASFAERARPLREVARLLRERKSAHAAWMAREMGKPLAQGEGESEKCAWVCEWFADEAPRLLADLPIATENRESFVAFRPLGVIFAVMPWNFPFWQVFRAAAPTLMAGNGFALKHAPNVAGCAETIATLFRDAGLPEGVFTHLPIDVDLAPLAIAHPAVRGVTLTGSERAGRAVAIEAGRQLKKSVLELGGSDPYVVLDDADLEKTAELCVASRMLNAGQVCISAKRFIVVEGVRRDFEELVLAKMAAYEMRPPLETGSRLGPLARGDLRDTLAVQVERARAGGARLALGGTAPIGRAGGTPRRSCSTCSRAIPPSTTTSLALSPPSCRHATRRRRSRWPTPRASVSAERSSRATWSADGRWRATSSKSAPVRSTISSAATRACPSGASRARATATNWAH